MKCKYFNIEKLNEYFDNELHLNEKIEIEEHLKECEICRNYLNSLNGAISAVKNSAGMQEVPQRIWNTIENKIIKKKRVAVLWHYILIPAAASVVLMLSFLFKDINDEDKVLNGYIITQMSYLGDESLVDDWYFQEDNSGVVDLFFSEEL